MVTFWNVAYRLKESTLFGTMNCIKSITCNCSLILVANDQNHSYGFTGCKRWEEERHQPLECIAFKRKQCSGGIHFLVFEDSGKR
jgi:hypothetical protein